MKKKIKSLIIYSFLHIDLYCFTLSINIIPKQLGQNYPSLSDAVVKCSRIPAVLVAIINWISWSLGETSFWPSQWERQQEVASHRPLANRPANRWMAAAGGRRTQGCMWGAVLMCKRGVARVREDMQGCMGVFEGGKACGGCMGMCEWPVWA